MCVTVDSAAIFLGGIEVDVTVSGAVIVAVCENGLFTGPIIGGALITAVY